MITASSLIIFTAYFGALALFAAPTVLAQVNPFGGPGQVDDSLKGEAEDAVRDAGGDGAASLGDVITDIVNVLIYIVGAASVIMIVIGGIRYVLSSGDAQATQGAKDTILYAVIGVIVAAAAYTLVNFVINSI